MAMNWNDVTRTDADLRAHGYDVTATTWKHDVAGCGRYGVWITFEERKAFTGCHCGRNLAFATAESTEHDGVLVPFEGRNVEAVVRRRMETRGLVILSLHVDDDNVRDEGSLVTVVLESAKVGA